MKVSSIQVMFIIISISLVIYKLNTNVLHLLQANDGSFIHVEIRDDSVTFQRYLTLQDNPRQQKRTLVLSRQYLSSISVRSNSRPVSLIVYIRTWMAYQKMKTATVGLIWVLKYLPPARFSCQVETVVMDRLITDFSEEIYQFLYWLRKVLPTE